jgi:diguanylate cyclase (GGDEF)-like protein
MKEKVDSVADVKAVEVLFPTHVGLHVQKLFNALEQCDESIAVFGAAAGKYEYDSDTFVFNEEGISVYGILGVIYSGVDFHINISYALGWKELGHSMTVTKVDSDRLYELDGEPAFNVYKKYLKIQNDSSFSRNALEFPLMHKENEVEVARIPLKCTKDGTLILGGEIKDGDTVRLGYGDPGAILDNVYEAQDRIRLFQPQGIFLYSCMTRKSFWGDDIDIEISPFDKVAHTSGFYTFGEYLRIGAKIYVHNATLIAIGMREKSPVGIPVMALPNIADKKMSGEISMVERLVSFIQATTGELEKLNRNLAKKALTDDLTRMYNRRRIEEVMEDFVAESKIEKDPIFVFLLDIDYFKQVNDNYGHDIGDMVLRKVAEVLKEHMHEDCLSGRWGGEEFMIVARHITRTMALDLAETLRKDISAVSYEPVPKLTVSIGIVEMILTDTVLDLYRRVDKALYHAKKAGRDCVYFGSSSLEPVS